MLVKVLDATFKKTYERGLHGNVPQNKNKNLKLNITRYITDRLELKFQLCKRIREFWESQSHLNNFRRRVL